MKKSATQLFFNLPYISAHGRDDFLISSCNEMAVAWIDRWPQWDMPVICVWGPAGSGKTHLLHSWKDRADALFLSGADLKNLYLDKITAGVRAIAIDDADKTEDGTILFHLYNIIREKNGSMLITAQQPPSRWNFGPADMLSRLAACAAIPLHDPDENILQAVMAKQFHDRQLPVDSSILKYLVVRMPRTFAAARSIVEELDHAALMEKKKVSLKLAAQILSQNVKDF